MKRCHKGVFWFELISIQEDIFKRLFLEQFKNAFNKFLLPNFGIGIRRS